MDRAATQSEHRPKIATIFVAAFLGGAAAAIGVNRFLDVHRHVEQPAVESEPIFVASRGIAAGDPVTVWDVSLKDWPKATAPADALRIEDSLEGQFAIRTVREGQPLVRSNMGRQSVRQTPSPVAPAAVEDSQPFDLPDPPRPAERSTSLDGSGAIATIGSPDRDTVGAGAVGEADSQPTLSGAEGPPPVADVATANAAPVTVETVTGEMVDGRIAVGSADNTPPSDTSIPDVVATGPEPVTVEPVPLRDTVLTDALTTGRPSPTGEPVAVIASPEGAMPSDSIPSPSEGGSPVDSAIATPSLISVSPVIPSSDATIAPASAMPARPLEPSPSEATPLADATPIDGVPSEPTSTETTAVESGSGAVEQTEVTQMPPLRFLVIPERIAALVDGPSGDETDLRTIEPPDGLVPQSERNPVAERSSQTTPSATIATPNRRPESPTEAEATASGASGRPAIRRLQTPSSAPSRGAARSEGSTRQRPPTSGSSKQSSDQSRPAFRSLFPNVSAGMSRIGTEIGERLRRTQE